MRDPNSPVRAVRAQSFRAWWARLSELAEENPDNAGARNLLQALHAFGERAGATEPYLEWGDSPPGAPFSKLVRGAGLVSTFDWENGEIDLGSGIPDGETLVASLVQETGIPE